MPNVLLIYPQFPETFWSFSHALPFIHKKAVSPPLGLMTVASMLPEGWNNRLVDLNVQRLTYQDLQWADSAFISAMTAQRSSTQETIRHCKEAGLLVVAGGPLFVYEHQKFPLVDHFVLNEAEITLPRFLEDFENRNLERVYRTDQHADITTTPAPQWDLIDSRRYATMNIQFSRGCPYNCDFCNVTALLGHRPRTKTAAQIINELDQLYRAGWRESIFFVDDNFIGNRKVLKNELLPALIEWRRGKKGITFSTEASINLADDPVLMDMLARAGFNTVFIGIETPDEDSLSGCNKKQNIHRDLIADVKRIQRAGLQVQGGFIVGFDNDLPSIFQRQIDFIQQSGIVTAMVGMLQAPPGTRLYERMQQEGRLTALLSGDNVDGSTNILPKMGLDTLREGYRQVIGRIYRPEYYYARVKTFLKEFQPAVRQISLTPENIWLYAGAFLRSVYRLGILGKERWHYWRLLTWTLVRRPKLFPYAVTFAIYGHHFRKISERIA